MQYLPISKYSERKWISISNHVADTDKVDTKQMTQLYTTSRDTSESKTQDRFEIKGWKRYMMKTIAKPGLGWLYEYQAKKELKTYIFISDTGHFQMKKKSIHIEF